MEKRNLLLKCLLVLLCFSATTVFAQPHVAQKYATNAAQVLPPRKATPVEAFIARVKETNKFETVSNIWAPDANFDKTALLNDVEDAQPLLIDYTQVASLIRKNTLAISLVVPGLNGKVYTINMAQYNYLAGDFTVNTMAGNVETPFHYTPGKYYQGVIDGIPGSVAAFSFFNNEVFGIFSIPGVGNMTLVPNKMVSGKYADNQNYLLYNDHDLKITDKAPGCATDKLPIYGLNSGRGFRTTTTLNNNVYNNCKEIRVFEVGDYSMYVSEGSNSTSVTNYLTAVFNNEATLYRNEGVPIVIGHLQINTTSDSYQTLVVGTAGSSDYLDMFGDNTQNTYKTTWNCDICMLASTRDGSLGGVAWLQALCQNYGGSTNHNGSYAYSNIDVTTLRSFPTYSWDVEVMTHETGHNLGSPHTHRCCWNPPGTGITPIDGCYATVSGGAMEANPPSAPTCAIPASPLPAGGGTIMSYCHLTSDGINFSNGFGQQPGDTIRYWINRASTCGAQYTPSVALAIPSRTIAANRECTDLVNGITYYWNDHNTADQSDDTLVLMINKGSNNIGNLDDGVLTVKANTIIRYGSGLGDTLNFPSGTSANILSHNYGMRRYWTVTPTAEPTTAVEVMYPFLTQDTLDVRGSVLPLSAPLSGYLFYTANSPIDPNPANGFPSSTNTSFSIYTYSVTPSTTTWSLSTVGTTQLAHMKMTNLAGGGTGFYSYCTKHPAPTIAAAPPAPCPGAVVVYSVTPDIGAASYTWSVTGTGWSGSSTTGSISLTAGTATGFITVIANDSCGAGNPTTFNISPAPYPSVTLDVTSGLCTGDPTAAFAANVTSGGPALSYTWTVTGTGWTASGPTNASTFTANAGTGTATITVSATNTCGAGPVASTNVTMNNAPPTTPTTITPPALVCPSSIGTFTTPTVTGATSYTWTVAGTGWSGFSSSNAISVNIGTGVGTFTVTASNACGTSGPYSRSVNTSTGPGAATAINSSATPCSGNSETLTTPAVLTASSYNWTVAGTGWSGSSNSSSISVVVGSGPGVITVSPINACGIGSSYTTTISPAPAPTSAFALSSHIIPAYTSIVAVYTGVASAGATYLWNFSGGVGTPGTGSGPQTIYWTVPGQYIVFLTVSNGAGCTSATADTVDVLPATGIQNVTIDKIGANIIPNPNNGVFDILFSEPVNQSLAVKLFDMQGRAVYSNAFSDAKSRKISVETNDLPSGTYTVTIYVNEAIISRKITIYK